MGTPITIDSDELQAKFEEMYNAAYESGLRASEAVLQNAEAVKQQQEAARIQEEQEMAARFRALLGLRPEQPSQPESADDRFRKALGLLPEKGNKA